MEELLVYGAYAAAGILAVAVYVALPKRGRAPRAALPVLLTAIALGGLVMLLSRLLGDVGGRFLFCLLSLIAVVAGIAVPRFSSAMARQRLDAAARRIVADLSLARRQARTSTTSQTVSFDVKTHSYRLVGMAHPNRAAAEYRVSLSEEPYQATLVSADFGGDAEIVFDGHGVPDTSGSVVIQVGSRQEQIDVDADTGKATTP